MSADQERFVSRWIPSNLNVETRSTAPDEVKKGGNFLKRPKDQLFVFMYVNLHIVIGCPGE